MLNTHTLSLDEKHINLRERLEAIMLFRVVLVTLFLGSTVVIDISALSSLSDPRNFVLLALIVGTYSCTIAYAIALNTLRNLLHLAYAQLAVDLLIITTLVLVTGGLESVFVFLFHIVIINTAVLMGRSGALSVAAAASLSFIYLALISLGIISTPEFFLLDTARPVGKVMYEVGMNSSASFLIAVLAGYLAERLGEATIAIERQQFDIQELRAINRNILASLDSGLIAINADDQIIYFNQAASDITGWPSSEILGQRVTSVSEELGHLIQKAHPSIMTQSSPRISYQLTTEYQRPDGKSLYLGVSSSVLRSSLGDPAGKIVVFHDISDMHALEQQMKRAERLAAIGKLAAAIAHEIRNPLASISGSVEMLQNVPNLTADDQSLMRIVVREVDRLDKLISDFLEYSRPRAMEFHEVELHALIDDVLTLFDHRPGTECVRIELLRNPCDDEAAFCQLDKESFHQVFWNLLNNAIESVSDKEGGDARIDVELYRDLSGPFPSGWVISIEDSGTGVNPDVEEHIFEPFFTTKAQGTGLGLATSYRIIEEHGGHLIYSKPKRLTGSRFEIHLPGVLPPYSIPKRQEDLQLTQQETVL